MPDNGRPSTPEQRVERSEKELHVTIPSSSSSTSLSGHATYPAPCLSKGNGSASASRASTAPSSPGTASPRAKKVSFSPVNATIKIPSDHYGASSSSSLSKSGLGISRMPPLESPHLTTKYVPMSSRDERLLHPPPFSSFLKSPTGRESLLRFLQYSLRLTVFLQSKSAASKRDNQSLSRLLATVQSLSAVRRVMNLVALYELRRSLKPLAFSLDMAVHVVQALFDLVATVSDNVYLVYRLKLFPISPARAHKADKLADLATLSSSIIGLAHVEHSRRQNWIEGVQRRKALWTIEDKLDEAIEDEIKAGENGPARDRCREREKALRERAKSERRKLKALRTEMSDLYWERIRLGAEAVFSLYDLRGIQVMGETVRTVSGMVSASIGLVQAWKDRRRL